MPLPAWFIAVAALLRDGFRNWADFNLQLLKFYRAQYVTCVVTIIKKNENLLSTGGSQFLLGILSLYVFSVIAFRNIETKLKTEFVYCKKNCVMREEKMLYAKF